MKASRALGIGIVVFQILSITLLSLSLYTIVSTLAGISSNSFKVNMVTNQANGDVRLILDADPRNRGLLGIDLSLELAFINLNGDYVARNSTSVHIEPDSHRAFSVSLFVPSKEIPNLSTPGDKGTMELVVRIRTLSDLVGFTNVLRIKGGVGG